MYPIFFSVSSQDVSFAEEIWKQFPSDWIYLYSKTGEEGAHMWDEISRRELPKSRVIIVFWSRNFVKAGGCLRELRQARTLVREGRLACLVLRLDEYPITWKDGLDEETREAFQDLEPFLDIRTSAPKVEVDRAISLVQRVAEPILKSDHPRLQRHDILQTLQRVIQKGRFKYFPAIWVSGFNGVGRETLTRDFNRNFTQNGRGILIEVNEASLPKQTLLMIESEAFRADTETLLALHADPEKDRPTAVADAIERVFVGGNYVIFRHSRIIEENVELPEWINDVVNALTSGTRPKLFIISQLPLLAERHNRCRDSLVAQRVPTVDEHQMVEFCNQLIGHFDRNPDRWREVEINSLVRAAGGNLGFLISLVRGAAAMEDFDQIDQMIAHDTRRMTASITTYVRWGFLQLRDFQDEQKTLLFLNDVSPCDITDLEKAIDPKRPMLRVLGKLLGLGLVERESDGLYRLTPLLAHRLSRDLVRPELVQWLRNAYVKFVSKPFDVKTEGHEYLKIETRIKASLWSGSEDIPDNVIAFISASHWFQAGVRLYHARHREPAYRLLKKAFDRRLEFTANSRTELIRYYGLSAIQNRRYPEAETCIQLLDGAHQTKAISAFLNATLLEHKRRTPEAIREYERAIKLNIGKDSRLERTYRPLIKCILETSSPDFQKAENYALDWRKLRETVFSLKALARVYLYWKHRGAQSGRDIPDNIDNLYIEALQNLEAHPGVEGAHFELKAEEAGFSRDFPKALDYMDRALEADPRFELRSARWRLMAKSGIQAVAEQALTEMDAARSNADYRSNWVPFLPVLAETYALALKTTGQSPGMKLNTFAPELLSDEIGKIVNRVKRNH